MRKSHKSHFTDFSIIVPILIIFALAVLGIGIYENYKEATTIEDVRGKILSVDSRITSNENGGSETVHTIYFKHDNGVEEMFESRDNLAFGKYNNMEIIMKAKANMNKTVIMRVSGMGKSGWRDYRNIIDIKSDV